MDTMVLLVGIPRSFEEDDCACSHDLTGVRKQVSVEKFRLHAGGDALETVPVNFQFCSIARM